MLPQLDTGSAPSVRVNASSTVAIRSALDRHEQAENDGLNWPRCDGLNWPHLRPIVA